MKYSAIIDELGSVNAGAWQIYRRAMELQAQGRDVVEMAIGEPGVPTPDAIVDAAVDALRVGRTEYSSGQGEENLRRALAARYTKRLGRAIGAEQILALPGTQAALYLAMRTVAGTGDDVIVGDPMYATYDPVVASSGARRISVPLRPERGFRLAADDVAAAVTPQTTAVLVNTPHNPTGAVLTDEDVTALGEVAREHDLWLIVDEVYEDLVFPGATFVSPLADADLGDRVIVLNSISKSHAAPGFRSGWIVASEDFCERALPLAEAMLFGNQPFIADATAAAVSAASPVAPAMIDAFSRRAAALARRLHGETSLRVNTPQAGMFALVDVSATGMDGRGYANDLLDRSAVAVMPGSSFGESLTSWVRVSLTRPDDRFDEGVERIIGHAQDIAHG